MYVYIRGNYATWADNASPTRTAIVTKPPTTRHERFPLELFIMGAQATRQQWRLLLQPWLPLSV